MGVVHSAQTMASSCRTGDIGNERGLTSSVEGVQTYMDSTTERMKNRAEIYAADLYVLLQREFRRRQSSECSSCYVQLPYRVDRQDRDSANWEVSLPLPCPHRCRALMDELAGEFAQLYDLKLEPPSGRA